MQGKFFTCAIIILFWVSNSLQIPENQKNSFSDKLYASKFSREIVLIKENQITVLIEQDFKESIIFNEIFSQIKEKSLESIIENPSKSVQCQELEMNQGIRQGSFFDPKINIKKCIEFWKCADIEENIGVLVIDINMIEKSSFSCIDLIKADQIFLHRNDSEIKNKHNFYRRTVDEDLLTLYNTAKGLNNDVPLAIMQVAIDPSLTESFHLFLVSELLSYAFPQGESFTISYDSQEYLRIHKALLILMEGHSLTEITSSTWNSLYSICSAAYQVSDPQNYPTSFFPYYLRAASNYLSKFLNLDLTQSEYSEKITSINNNIELLFIGIMQNARITMDTTLIISSNINKNQDKYIITTIKTDFGASSDGTCDFNDNGKIVLSISNLYVKFGPQSDIYSYAVYILGTEAGLFDTFFVIAIKGTTNNCFSKQVTLQVYDDSGSGYTCLSTGQTCSSLVKSSVASQYFVTFTIKNFGIYIISQVCSIKYMLSKTDYKCYKCIDNCDQCSDLTTCNQCTSPYLIMPSKTCVPNCPVTYYKASNSCLLCSKDCYSCTNSTACTSCVDENFKLTKYNSFCNCDSSCGTCTNNTACLTCKLESYVKLNEYNTLCAVSCPVGKYNNNGYCKNCEALNCANCNISPTSCDSCKSGYLKDSNNQCQIAYRYYQNLYKVSFEFDYSLSFIYLTCNKKIMLVTSTNCGLYFTTPEVFGTGSACTLKSNYILQITLGTGWSVRDTTTLTTKNTFQMAEGDLLFIFTAQDIIPIYPVDLDVDPHPKISGETTISLKCSVTPTFIYSSTQSSSIGFESLEYEWSLDINIDFQGINDKNCYIPAGAIFQYSTFTLTLKLTNFLLRVAKTSVTINVVNTEAVTFKLDTGLAAYYKRSQGFTMGPVNFDLCGKTGTFAYAWTILLPDGNEDMNFDIAKDYSRLYIPALTLGYGLHVISLTITMTLDNGSKVYGTAKSDINIYSSNLVTVLNKVNQDIKDNDDFTISGAKSYDPDKYSFTYAWTTNCFSIIDTSSSITIPYSEFKSLTLFDLTLTISSTEPSPAGRISSSKITLTVIKELKVSVTIPLPQSKTKKSNQFTLGAKIKTDSDIITVDLQWAQTSGSQLTFSSTNTAFLTFLPNILLPGTSYSFKITATVYDTYSVSSSASAEAFIKVNIGPICPNKPVVTPNTGGIAFSTKFTATIVGCYDGDNEDLPLKYKFHAKTNSLNLLLTTATENSVLSNILLSKSVKAIYITVTDSLGDSNGVESDSFIISSAKRSLRMLNEMADFYNELKLSQNLIGLINIFLDEFTVDEEMMDFMWEDFTNYMKFEHRDREYLENIVLMIRMFIQENQDQKIVEEKLDMFVDYLVKAMEEVEYIDEEVEKNIIHIAERIIEIHQNIEDAMKMKILLQKLLSFRKVYTHKSYSYTKGTISIFEEENHIQNLHSPIQIGTTSLYIKSSEHPSNSYIRIEVFTFSIGLFSDVLDISLTTDKEYKLGEVKEQDKKDYEITQGMIKAYIKQETPGIPICKKLVNNNWEEKGCEVLSVKGTFTEVSIKESGTYVLFYKETYNESSKASLYVLICIIGGFLVSFLVIQYLKRMKVKNVSYFVWKIVNTEPDLKEENKLKNSIEMEVVKRKTDTLKYHLILSLCFSWQDSLEKSVKCVIIASGLVSSLLADLCLLEYFMIHPVFVSLIGEFTVFWILLTIYSLLSKQSNIAKGFGLAMIICIVVASLIWTIYFPVNTEWAIAYSIGVGIQLLVSHSIFMMMRVLQC